MERKFPLYECIFLHTNSRYIQRSNYSLFQAPSPDSPAMSTRPIYLTVYSSPMFAAHWSIWIPDCDANTQKTTAIGKRIHVHGDSRVGFDHEFVRNFNMDLDERTRTDILLGWTDTANVAARTDGDTNSTDKEARDIIEKWALTIPAPGPSLRDSSSSATDIFQAPRTRVKLQNCQTWMTELVAKLIEEKILDEGANTVIANAPKN
ncbi:hypothetical protein CJF31_00003916 [Rutstroemia sp. NJR-2017a BVV2]|nr:hypothetical protein CJF31_00003916 [Rutstroemia sp. NJR-2017a BVV2]